MYQGRFAPSPSGRLHGGSLLTGLSATLRAISQHGHCLTRIEDLDFPRCEPCLTPLMLQELSLLGFFPFNELNACEQRPQDLAIQSHNMPVYKKAIGQLYQNNIAYCCNCTRAELKLRPCNCAAKHISLLQDHSLESTPPHAESTATNASAKNAYTPNFEQIADLAVKEQYVLRIELDKYLKTQACATFHDELLGIITQPQDNSLASSLVIQRRDGIIAYNLAVVLDEHHQGITEVVRGADLLETTFLQLALYQIFGYQPPKFLHVPLLLDPHGHKLSKQNHAPAILGTLLPHQATVQAALQLNQDLSPRALDILREQQTIALQASQVIYNQLMSEGDNTDFIDLSILGESYRHQKGLKCLSLKDENKGHAAKSQELDLLDPVLHIYVKLFLAAATGASKLEQVLQEHIRALPPCCDQKRGDAELESPLLAWSKILTYIPEPSFQHELQLVVGKYMTLQRSLIKEIGHNFNLHAIPHTALSC